MMDLMPVNRVIPLQREEIQTIIIDSRHGGRSRRKRRKRRRRREEGRGEEEDLPYDRWMIYSLVRYHVSA